MTVIQFQANDMQQARDLNVTPQNRAENDVGLTERRQSKRSPVLKSARLVFGAAGSVHNCLVLDESAGGVLVDLGAFLTLPDDVTLQFVNGPSYLAHRSWTAGTMTGLQFAGRQIVDNPTADRMKKIADILRLQGLAPAVETLRAARCFDNSELRRIADEAEASQARLEAALEGRLSV